MKTKAVRIYGQNDIRLEEFELPEMQDDEILAKVISDSVCMSTHKAVLQGGAHARVPNDVAENPTIIEEFIRALGAEPVIYPYRNECCGGYISLREKEILNYVSKGETNSQIAQKLFAEYIKRNNYIIYLYHKSSL